MIVIDSRLPPLLDIDEPNRQQMRRAERGQAKCIKCYRPCPADDVCFADGQDAHRSCAEMWNFEMFNGWEQFKAQDAEQAAREGTLWTLPSVTPAAPVLTS